MKPYNIRIRECREDRDINQTTIAELLKTSQTVYSRYERGERLIPITHLITLARYYGTSTDYLLGLTDMRQPYPRAKGQ